MGKKRDSLVAEKEKGVDDEWAFYWRKTQFKNESELVVVAYDNGYEALVQACCCRL